MKQKTDSSQPVTKGDLQIFKDEIKQDLDNRFDKFATAIRNEMQYGFQIMQESLGEQLTKFSNILHNATDPLTKDIETRRQEKAVVANQIHEVREEITILKKRVTKLEQTPHAV